MGRSASTAVLIGIALVPLWAAPTGAMPMIPCAGDAAPRDAIETAEAHLRARWRFDGASIHAAFEARLPPANPFDLTAQAAARAASRTAAPAGLPSAVAPPAEEPPIRGHVWGQGLACRIEAMAPQGPFVVRYYTSAITFHEGQGWSPPLRGGAIQVLGITRQGDGWRLLDRSAELTVLLPGAVLRKPTAEELPPPNRPGLVPCSGVRVWNGRTCVAPAERPGSGATQR